MRQVIIVLIALLAVSIFMPAIPAKQGNTGPALVGPSNLTNSTNVTQTLSGPDTAIFGSTSSMQNFLNGAFSGSSANYQDVSVNNGNLDIYQFLNPSYTPSSTDVFTSPSPVFKMHQIN